MTTWTTAAKEELERYFSSVRHALTASGADAGEVIEDLRRHIEEEAAAANLTVVTAPDVRRLLARIGAPEPVVTESQKDSTRESLAKPEVHPHTGKRPGVWLLALGVAIPAITLAIEWLTGMCAGAFFDPLPSLWHVGLVAAVPIVNALVWSAVARGAVGRRRFLGWANGFACGVAVYYAFLLLPLLLPGLFAIVFFGWGLLPWAPLLAFISALFLRHCLQRMPEAGGGPLPGFWRGLLLAWLALAVVNAPVWLTRWGMETAVSQEPAARQRGLEWLRRVGNKEVLLRECYGRTPAAERMDVLGWLFVGDKAVTPQKARELYYRVTGKPFNSVPAPTVRTGRGRWAGIDDWSWDSDQGGDRVGGRVKGLYLDSSRIDAVVEPDAATAYTEWTLVFRNDSKRQAEARAQVQLPPGGVVSRLTLWVDGEEREAAFGPRGRVREAYQRVAIRQRRDPVLVTTCGPDRVLMQCFPVPPDGGEMRVRFGITAPLTLLDSGEAMLQWPRLAERNFTMSEPLRHIVWAESPSELTAAGNGLRAELPKPGLHALRGQLRDTELGLHNARVRRDATSSEVWTKDTFVQPAALVRQRLTETAATPPPRIVLVLDGSDGMEPTYPDAAGFIRRIPSGIEVAVLVARDTVSTLGGPGFKAGVDSLNKLAEEVLKLRSAGGQDNAAALEEAWDLAAGRAGGVIVWIHGPQPVMLTSAEGLRQRYERRTTGPTLLDLQTELGPNRIVEQLDHITDIRAVPVAGSLSQSLDRLANSWQAGVKTFTVERTRSAFDESVAPSGGRGSLHLARLWARDEVERLRGARRIQEAADVAAQYQLVTPVSGAVVLETQAQYLASGLEPVDAATVPSIPEPGTLALFGVGVAALLGMRLWRRHRLAAGQR